MRVYALAVLLIAGSLPTFSDELEDSFQRLKQTQAAKDAQSLKKCALETSALARKVAAEPAPESEMGKDYWTKRVAYAREVELYTEYALCAAALEANSAATTVDLIGALEAQNPDSKYLRDIYARYFLALNSAGASGKIPAIAEKAVKHFPDNQDLLIVLAEHAMSRKDVDRALTYAERAIAVLATGGPPEGMPGAEWDKKRTAASARCRWIAGLMHSEKGQYFQADKDLRVALPMMKGNDSMLAPLLFHLAIANYQLGASTRDRAQMLEAARLSEEAAKIKGPLSQQAWRNAQAMRAEAQKIR